MVKIENTYDSDIELHWFSATDTGWQFVNKEIIKPGESRERHVCEFYYFKVVKNG